jgi:hypothetical protein
MNNRTASFRNRIEITTLERNCSILFRDESLH